VPLRDIVLFPNIRAALVAILGLAPTAIVAETAIRLALADRAKEKFRDRVNRAASLDRALALDCLNRMRVPS
jgi:hypothetical protein